MCCQITHIAFVALFHHRTNGRYYYGLPTLPSAILKVKSYKVSSRKLKISYNRLQKFVLSIIGVVVFCLFVCLFTNQMSATNSLLDMISIKGEDIQEKVEF